jgi:hypothetical protein
VFSARQSQCTTALFWRNASFAFVAEIEVWIVLSGNTEKVENTIGRTGEMMLLSRSESTDNKTRLTMNKLTKQETVNLSKVESPAGSNEPDVVESLTVPIGTFGGSLDRILRIRKGKPVPGDTGDQGGGQN